MFCSRGEDETFGLLLPPQNMIIDIENISANKIFTPRKMLNKLYYETSALNGLLT